MKDEKQAQKKSIAQFGSAEIAEILGIGVRRLQQLTKEGIIPKIAHGKYEIAEVVTAFLEWKVSQYENAQEDDQNLRKERTLLTRVQRKKAEHELAIMKGELHKSEDVERVMNDMLSSFRARCLVIPNRAASLVVNKTIEEARTMLKAEIYEALQELSDYDPEKFYRPDQEAAGDED